ncbi:MAG: hypothetical protein II909_00580, partial [Kiritimatiellae bacterium]|nr:hypothetical protein [Kiritimatiellia bacterium]
MAVMVMTFNHIEAHVNVANVKMLPIAKSNVANDAGLILTTQRQDAPQKLCFRGQIRRRRTRRVRKHPRGTEKFHLRPAGVTRVPKLFV